MAMEKGKQKVGEAEEEAPPAKEIRREIAAATLKV